MELLDATTRIALRNILFATDFSAQAEGALPFAISLASRYGARLYLVHVIHPGLYMYAPVEGAGQVADEIEQMAKGEMQRLDARLGALPHQTLIRHGDIWEVLSGMIQRMEIDLMVVGTHGRTGLGKLLLGSIAEGIFRQAPCPVLTVGPAVAESPEAIVDLHEVVYATDFSVESMAAAPYAISLAQEHQAQLSLLHVVQHPNGTSRKDPEHSAAHLLHRLHGLVPPEAELWCHPKCFVEYGEPAARILEAAEQRHADLIVLGVRRPAGQVEAKTHLGRGTAYKVASASACPVLTVRG
jgi:nucleotide-binding universal stress UspA family protein